MGFSKEIKSMIKSDILITSRQNPTVKRVCALLEKKERETSGLFRFDGIKLFLEAVDCGLDIDGVYIKESAWESICSRASAGLSVLPRERIICVSDAVFDKMSEERAPEGIITVAKHIDKFRKIDTIINISVPSADKSVLLVESVRDPGNLGTVIRSAAALGVGRIVMSADCADVYNPKTIRAAMGGLFRADILRIDVSLMPEYISRLRESGRRVFAAALDPNALMLGEFETARGDCFVIGNEGHGLSREVIGACDRSVMIPMHEGCESLNAAAASVILMWEMQRANK